jgi:hypothetical protein
MAAAANGNKLAALKMLASSLSDTRALPGAAREDRRAGPWRRDG